VIASANGITIDTTSGTSGPSTTSRAASESGSSAITLNSSADPTTPTPVARPSGASQVGGSDLQTPTIVDSTSRRPAEPAGRATVTQLQSGGPIVALSGTAVVVTHAVHRTTSTRRTRAAGVPRAYAQALRSSGPVAASSIVQVNAAGVNVFISANTARRPSAANAHPVAVDRGQIGSPGSLDGLLPTSPRPDPSPGGPANTTLFGSASGSAGGSSLLGIDALLAIAAVISAAAWRRRSWDLPLLPRQSALLSLALDRPG